jgi:cobalt-zinc-cadmium efflux system membrane fusion protein
VFVRVNGGFAPVPVKTGRDNGQLVEITAGLAAGTTYAANGSFVLKSELGKGSAAHEH